MRHKQSLFFANAQNKGITGILVLIAVLVVAVLFFPLPYYQKGDVYCDSYPPQLCAKKGWNFGKPLWKQILKTQETTDSSSVSTQQPTLDPTADWKTYANTNLGFQIRYPDSVEITNEDSNTVLVKWNSSDVTLFTVSRNLIDLSEYKKCVEILPDPVPEDLYPCYIETTDRYDIKKVDRLGEVLVIDIETAYWGTDRSERIIRKASNPEIEILQGHGAGYDPKGETLFAEILSTFKFTSQ